LTLSPKKLYSFKIDPEVAKALKTVKERDGIGESEQIRRGIRLWLREQGIDVTAKSAKRRAGTRRKA
jgi:hypothetical protein